MNVLIVSIPMNKNEVEFEMHLKKMDTVGTLSWCSH